MTTEATPIEPRGDPTIRTIAALHREIFTLDEKTRSSLDNAKEIAAMQFDSAQREMAMLESHRLELKADNQRTVETAMIAAEKAVQAALAAAEKAREQQTIASQLATTKSEEASKEQMKQQGETFTLAIAGLTSGFNDMKGLVGELRAEKRGGKEAFGAIYAFAGFLAAVVVIGGFFMAFGVTRA